MKCRICGNKEKNRVYHVPEMMFGYRDMFRYFLCSKCDCLQIAEFPADLSKYYPRDYYSFHRRAAKGAAKKYLIALRDQYSLFGTNVVGKLLSARFPNESLQSLRPLSINFETRVLDVGCGAGKLLYSIYEAGIKNCLGIDPFNAGDVRYSNGLEIKKRKIYDVGGMWDIVMFHHSFEHVPDPIETLQAVSKLLAPRGVCIVRIPTTSSYVWKYYRENWVQLDAPRHFYLHSIKSMKAVADRAQLRLRDLVYDSTSFQFWGSEQYLNNIPLQHDDSYAINRRASLFSRRDIANFTKRAKKLNELKQGDQVVFYFENAKNGSY